MEKTVIELFAGVCEFRVGLNNIISYTKQSFWFNKDCVVKIRNEKA